MFPSFEKTSLIFDSRPRIFNERIMCDTIMRLVRTLNIYIWAASLCVQVNDASMCSKGITHGYMVSAPVQNLHQLHIFSWNGEFDSKKHGQQYVFCSKADYHLILWHGKDWSAYTDSMTHWRRAWFERRRRRYQHWCPRIRYTVWIFDQGRNVCSRERI
jgi:hypothetical protein